MLRHRRYIKFQMVEVAVSAPMSGKILARTPACDRRRCQLELRWNCRGQIAGEVRLGDRKTEVDHDETAASASPEGWWNVLSELIDVEIAGEGPNGYDDGRKQRSSGQCRSMPRVEVATEGRVKDDNADLGGFPKGRHLHRLPL